MRRVRVITKAALFIQFKHGDPVVKNPERIRIRCSKKLDKRFKRFLVDNDFRTTAQGLEALLNKWEGKPVRYT